MYLIYYPGCQQGDLFHVLFTVFANPGVEVNIYGIFATRVYSIRKLFSKSF